MEGFADSPAIFPPGSSLVQLQTTFRNFAYDSTDPGKEESLLRPKSPLKRIPYSRIGCPSA